MGHLLCQGISSISAVCLRPPPAWAGPFSVKQTRTPARMGFLPNKLSPQAVVPRTSYFARPLPCQRDTSSTARVLVVSTPAARCDYRQRESPALADQFLISARI